MWLILENVPWGAEKVPILQFWNACLSVAGIAHEGPVSMGNVYHARISYTSFWSVATVAHCGHHVSPL